MIPPTPVLIIPIACSFIAAILLAFASVSPPTWDKVSFFDTNANGELTRFGLFGYTGSLPTLGWYFPGNIGDDVLNGTLYHNFTHALLMIPVAAGLNLSAFCFGLLGHFYHHGGTSLACLVSALSVLFTSAIWIIQLILFTVAREHVRAKGFSADYGNAVWLTTTAMALQYPAFFVNAYGVLRRYRGLKVSYP